MESETLEEEESHLIINAVKDANIPKFITEDMPLFKSILADLFPGMDPPGPDNKLLKVNKRKNQPKTKQKFSFILLTWRVSFYLFVCNVLVENGSSSMLSQTFLSS